MIEKSRAIFLLKQVIDDEISPAQALELWGVVDDEPDDTIAAAWHELSHLANDEDLATDSAYLEQAKGRLRAYVDRIGRLN